MPIRTASTHRQALAIPVGVALLLALAGCAVAEAQDPVDPAPGDSTEQEPNSVDEDCLDGRWTLDTEDYRGQAEAYLKGHSIPLEDFAVSGTQTLEFTTTETERRVSLGTSLYWTGTLLGHGFEVRDESAGGGAWESSSMSPNQLVVDQWEWTVEPHVAPGDAPTVPPLALADSGPIDVVCTATTLELHGTDAILTGRFTRLD